MEIGQRKRSKRVCIHERDLTKRVFEKSNEKITSKDHELSLSVFLVLLTVFVGAVLG